MIDLSLITSEDLAKELAKRHDRCLLVYHDQHDAIQLYFMSCITDALGLASYADKRLYELLEFNED